MGKSHNFTELFKNENKGIVFKLICVYVDWYHIVKSVGLVFYTMTAPVLYQKPDRPTRSGLKIIPLKYKEKLL